MAGDVLNLAVLIFLPVVIQATAFVVLVTVVLALRDAFDNILAKLKSQ